MGDVRASTLGLGTCFLFLGVGCGQGDAASNDAARSGASGNGAGAGFTSAGAGLGGARAAGAGGGALAGAAPVGGAGGSGAEAGGGSANGGAAKGGSANGGAPSGSAGRAGDAGGMPSGGGGAFSNAGAGAAGTGGSAAGGGNDTACASPALAKGNSNRTIAVGGSSRTYILHVPSSYTGATRVPLVLDFHALGGTGSQEQSSSGYQQLADKNGFLIAFPDGIDNAWNIGPCCTNSRDVDDLGFAKAMVTAISKDGCVDATRVYATGFSMGGGMSQYLACNAADVFAAVAPASFDLLVPDEEPCMPSRPISVLAFRGTADTVVPFAGGQGSSGRVTFLGAQGSFERWAGIDQCVAPTTSDGDCTYYEHCGGGAEIGLCVKQGGSHAPGDANAGWAFLSRFTLP
jgi:polyhydroxybutyrate depolymerase